jgi:hypothetical protein
MFGQIKLNMSPEAVQRYNELIGRYYKDFEEIKSKFESFDWRYFEKKDEFISFLLRVVDDYYYREGLAMNPEMMKQLFEKFKKLQETKAIVGATVGALTSGLIAVGLIGGPVGAVIGGLMSIAFAVWDTAKAVSMSSNRSDDLGHRIDRLNKTDPFQKRIYDKGLEQLHTRPKCRAYASKDCANEHLRWVTAVDLFNMAYENLLIIREKITFENYLKGLGLSIEDLQKKAEFEIQKAEVGIEVKPKLKPGYIVLGLILFFLITKS